MANEKHFILDRLDTALESVKGIGEGAISSRGQTLLNAVQLLRNEVDKAGVSTGGDLDFQAIAQELVKMESGKQVARAVGTQELVGPEKYENLDPGWIQCLLEYVSSRPVDFPSPPVGGALYPLGPAENGEIKIALAGDWGTKNDPAIKIAGHIADERPHYTIHLGDIYYAGLPVDEKAFLINLWPRGRLGTFALNSNHEMYCGGKGYFQTIRDPTFGNQGFSYFALQNTDWLIVGLDTAYFAYNQSVLYEDGYLSDAKHSKGMAQVNWLRALLNDAQHRNKRLMLLTHHDGFDVKVGEAMTKGLYKELEQYVQNRECFWYWGHVHGGIVYRPTQLGASTRLYARCLGHGGVPYAPYPDLKTLGQGKIAVEWAEREKANTGDPRRAWNGYAVLTLNGPDIKEEFYDENGRKRWPNP
jgi:hypothetical protein